MNWYIEKQVKDTWDRRDKYKSDAENLLRIADAFNLTETEVNQILGLK